MEKIDKKLENIEEVMELLIGQMKSQDAKLSILVEHTNSKSRDSIADDTPALVDIPRKVYQYFRFETLPGFPTQRLPATAGLL